MAREETRLATELGRYWDLVVRNQGRLNMNIDLDESQMIDEMHALWNEEAPVGARARVRQQVKRQEGEVTAARNGLIWQPQGEPSSWPLAPSDARIWIPVSSATRKFLAAAAVLLFILGGGAILFNNYGGGNDSTTQAPAAFPAAQTTPAVATPALPPDAPVEFLWSVDSAGATPLQLPNDVEIAPDGNLWVLDADLKSVAIFSPDGEFIELWGGEGSGEGQFQQRDDFGWYGGSAFDGDGNYYVADPGNYRVQKFDANHQFLLEWGSKGEEDGQFETPTDVAIDSSGNVFVLDAARWDVQIFDPEGSFLSSFPVVTKSGAPVRAPGRLTIDDQDRVWVADSWQNRLFSYSSDGEFLSALFSTNTDLGREPGVIAIDKFGRILVATVGDHQIQILDETGELVTEWGGGAVLTSVFPGPPTGVAVNDEGNVYVVIADNEEIHDLYKFQLKPEFWPEE